MEQTAEFLGARRQAPVPDPADGGRVVGHHRHQELHPRAVRAFVAQVSGPPTQQAGDHTLDHRPTVAGCVGELHLAGRAGAVQVSRGQRGVDDLRRGRRRERLHRVGNPNREDVAAVQLLPQRGVVDGQVSCQRMDGRGRARGDLGTRGLGLVDQRLDIADITGITHGQPRGKDKPRRGLTENPGLAPKLGGTVTLAFANRGKGGIVGIDNFTLCQRLAVRQPPRLADNLLMGLQRERQGDVPAGLLVLGQLGRGLHLRLGGLGQRCYGRAGPQQVRFGLPHQMHKHFALPATLPSKAAHQLGQRLELLLGLRLQRGALGGTPRGTRLESCKKKGLG